MPRWNEYNYGDVFSEWHRQQPGLKFVDTDYHEICEKCMSPIIMAETARWNQDEYKDFRVTKSLAQMSNIEAYVILCKVQKLPQDILSAVRKYEERISFAVRALERDTGLKPNEIYQLESVRMKQIHPEETPYKDVSLKGLLRFIWDRRKKHKCKLPSSNG